MLQNSLIVFVYCLSSLTRSFTFGNETNEVKPITTEPGYPVYALPVRPFYHENGHPDAFWQHLRLLESDGHGVFFGSMDSGVVRLDGEGRFVEKIGRIGKGPGEYEERIISINANGDTVWILSREQLQMYQKGRFIKDIRVQSSNTAVWPATRTLSACYFAVNARHILLPFGKEAKPGQIGSVYDMEGNFLRTIQDPGFDTHLISLSKWSQLIMWRWFEGKWYGLYAHTPRLIVLDKQFNQIAEMDLDSVETRRYEENFFQTNRKSLANPRRNIPLFFTFQIVEGMGFAKSMSTLHHFDLKTGKTKALYYFSLNDPEYGRVSRCAFEHCVVLENGRVVLGNNAFKGELQFATLPPVQ